jgi:RNA polymerase sigma-70 factor (ECF subfamily)
LDEATGVTVARSDCQQWCGQSRRDEEAEDFDMAECVRRVRRRDEDAARRFMERLYPLVVKVVRAHLPRRTSEEDLVQTVFMKVFAHLDQYQGKVPLEHWVSRIAVNTSLNALKAEKSRPELRWADLSEETQYLFESLASEETDGWETQGMAARDLLRQLMARLNPPDRLVVTLLHLEEKSVAEVRSITGWSAALVKVRAFRARKKLQKFLRQLEERK